MSQSHNDGEYGLETLAVHAGQVRSQEGEMSVPAAAGGGDPLFGPFGALDDFFPGR